MTNSPRGALQPGLQPLPGVLDLPQSGTDAGYCADGVCHISSSSVPAQKDA
ncbi:hypothetical protein [Microbacterium sp.]|uniref:hypothetical protein n=1 Tax=Microbacterium sp. TaxID=51671 RepID=UPI002810C0F4|nr:hypothetical protein [Microbacterium sp.]